MKTGTGGVMHDTSRGADPATLNLVTNIDTPTTPQKLREPNIFFTRTEFEAILSLYGRKVVEGEWRDYAIGSTREVATFAIHRRASEQPLYRIEKRPKLARRQGAFSVIAATGLV